MYDPKDEEIELKPVRPLGPFAWLGIVLLFVMVGGGIFNALTGTQAGGVLGFITGFIVAWRVDKGRRLERSIWEQGQAARKRTITLEIKTTLSQIRSIYEKTTCGICGRCTACCSRCRICEPAHTRA